MILYIAGILTGGTLAVMCIMLAGAWHDKE